MTPAVLLRVHSRLRLAAAVGSRATRADHAEAGVLQGVKRLLDERVFEEEPGRVAVGRTAVRVSTFIQRVSEHLANTESSFCLRLNKTETTTLTVTITSEIEARVCVISEHKGPDPISCHFFARLPSE